MATHLLEAQLVLDLVRAGEDRGRSTVGLLLMVRSVLDAVLQRRVHRFVEGAANRRAGGERSGEGVGKK